MRKMPWVSRMQAYQLRASRACEAKDASSEATACELRGSELARMDYTQV